MDVFAFASRTETQGMVLAEAMAAGAPVVAVDASGVREVVRDGENGRLLERDDEEAFAHALAWIADLDPDARGRVERAVAATAERFSLARAAGMALDLYGSLQQGRLRIGARRSQEIEASNWAKARRRVGEEWKILRNIASAVGESVLGPREERPDLFREGS
jgi:hypothetical protein